MKPLGIRARVLLAALLPATLVAVVLALLYTTVVVRDLNFTHEQRAVALARQVASMAEFALFTRNQSALQGVVNGARAERDVASITVLSPQGELIVRSGPEPGGSGKSTRSVLEPVFSTEVPVESLFERRGSDAQPPPQLVLGYVVLELSAESVAARQRELAIAGLIATLGGLLFGWLVAMHLSRGVTRPILEVATTIERFGKGDMSARLKASPSSPLHTLEKGINRMADRLAQNRDELERRVAEATEELRLKKDEAEKANRSKSRFLAAASHDLRQPIHALRLFVEILRDELASDARTATLLGRIQSSVDTMSSMFDALLDISRLEAGVIETRLQDFPATGLLRPLELMFTPLAAQRGLRFTVVPSSAWLSSDPALLDRLLQNLVSNALKYTQTGRVLVGVRRRPSALSIEVWDTGPGIAREHHQAIFQEFFQVEGLGREAGKGLGLGLAIVERIAGLLGHPIRMRSAPGRGSMFAVEVPYGRPAAVAAPSAHRVLAAPRQFGGLRIGVIDDDATILQAMADLLVRWGCAPLCAPSAESLLARLNGGAKRLDLLICDYRLDTGYNGIEAVMRVRRSVGSRLPAILVTGDTAPDRLKEARDSGLQLLHKPVAPEHLRDVMHRLLITGNDTP